LNSLKSTPNLDNQSTTLPTLFPATYREYLLKDITTLYQIAYEYYVGPRLEQYNFRGLRFLQCHDRANFARNKNTGLVKVLAESCHLRFCPICNRTRERLIQRNVTDWLKIQRYPKFLTLTLKHSSESLQEQINRLYKSFQVLRRRGLLKKKVASGIWFFQITKNPQTKQWHPHLHCLLTGSYIPIRELSRQWLAITTDSHCVDIRLIKGVEEAACEVARYASCSCNIKKFDNWELDEIDKALHHRRLCGCWGKCRAKKMLSPQKYEAAEWQKLGSWVTVFSNIKTLPAAQKIFEAWRDATPLEEGCSLEGMENLVNDFGENGEILIE